MKHLTCGYTIRKFGSLFLGVSMLALLTGCEEANIALDQILGRTSPMMSASGQVSPITIIQAKRTVPGEKPGSQGIGQADTTRLAQDPAAKKRGPGEATAPANQVKPSAQPTTPPPSPKAAQPAPGLAEGKRREPGQSAPVTAQPPAAPGEPKAPREIFGVTRDPFRQPTEILPSECPPSMPLCRFDPAQLKLVGVIQVEDGQFKGMVEDPDGRGYFITAGMQIGRATVTQINAEGVTLHDHRTRKDVPMRLLREAREGRES